MDYRKTYCIYHPAQIITNFCVQKKCCIPLCPTCVCKHLDYHLKNGSNPILRNFNETIATVQNSIFSNMNSLQKTQTKIQSLNQSNKQITYKISELIFNAKVNIKQMIDKKFNDVEKQIMNIIENKNKQIGLHCNQKSKVLQEKILQQLDSLNQMNMDINSDKLPQIIITYLQKKQVITENLIKQSASFIQLNQKYKVQVQISKTILSQIQNILNKLANIKFNIPSNQQKKIIPFPQKLIINQPQRENHSQQKIFYNNSRSFLRTFQSNMTRPQTPILNNLRQNDLKFSQTIYLPQRTNKVSKMSAVQFKQNQNKIQRKTGISLQKKLDQSTHAINMKQNNNKILNPNQL